MNQNDIKKEVSKLEGWELRILQSIVRKEKGMVQTIMREFGQDHKNIVNFYTKLSKIGLLITHNNKISENSYIKLNPELEKEIDLIKWIINLGYENIEKDF